jgi:uncharacterized membrane protein YfcA
MGPHLIQAADATMESRVEDEEEEDRGEIITATEHDAHFPTKACQVRRRNVLFFSSSALCLLVAAVSSHNQVFPSSWMTLYPLKGSDLLPRLENDSESSQNSFSGRALEDAEYQQQGNADAQGDSGGEDEQQQEEAYQEAQSDDYINDQNAQEEEYEQNSDAQEEEANQNDDGGQDKNNEEKEHRPGEDDWFDDSLDDYVTDDTGSSRTYNDDFYAYIGDPRPPRLVPLSTRTLVGYVIVSMALMIGASGGIGGGGIVVPVYLLVMGLSPRVAIPIGAVTVLGGAMASTMINWTRRHPLADRPIIDWDLVLVMEPLTLVGALIGTLFHRVLSEKILVVLLVLLLSVSAHTTLTKAMRMYQAEKRYIRHLKAAQAEPPSGSPTWGSTNDPGDERKQESHFIDVEEKQQILIVNPDFVTLKSDLVEQEKFTPRSKIIALICMFSVLIFLSIMVGGGGYKSPWGIVCGSVAFWVVQVIMVAFLISSAWAAQTYLIARHEVKDMVRFDYVHGDIKWDTRSSILYPAIFVAAGVCAGMFGIGKEISCSFC